MSFFDFILFHTSALYIFVYIFVKFNASFMLKSVKFTNGISYYR